MSFRDLITWGKNRRIRMLRYVSLSKLERLETSSTTSGSASVSIFGTGASLSAGRSQAIQSRLDRVERALRRQKLLGKVSDPSLFQFLICESPTKEFIAQGVAVWVCPIENGFVVAGGSATYLDRNVDVFTSKGIVPGSNPSGYYAGLAAIYRQALDRFGQQLEIRRGALEGWPATSPDGFYHADADSSRPRDMPIWRIEPRDEVIATNLDVEEIFTMAQMIYSGAGDPWSGKIRQLLLVHTDHIFANTHPDAGSRLVVGSPLYVEQLLPAGDRG